ncbi:MAG: hypothetical protein ACYSW8_31800, partial [Planctomycetota bacterium]
MGKGKHTAPKGVEHLKAALDGTVSKYAGGWDVATITGGHSSKNIPLLFAAGDALIAYRTGDASKLLQVGDAVAGYLEAGKSRGAFHSEEFSTIYSRWIFMSLLVIYNVLNARGSVHADRLRRFLRSVVSLAALSASPQASFSHHKKDKKRVLATPYSLFGGPRSWVRGDGDDNKRDDEDAIVWHDADSMCELIDHMLGVAVMGKAGNNFLYQTIKRVKDIWPGNKWNPLTAKEASFLSDLTVGMQNDGEVERAIDYIREYPIGPARGEIHILRDPRGNVVTLYTHAYQYGSTSFMQMKEFDVIKDKFFTVGVADPKKRSNGEMSTARIIEKNGAVYAEVTANDGTIFDMDSL